MPQRGKIFNEHYITLFQQLFIMPSKSSTKLNLLQFFMRNSLQNPTQLIVMLVVSSRNTHEMFSMLQIDIIMVSALLLLQMQYVICLVFEHVLVLCTPKKQLDIPPKIIDMDVCCVGFPCLPFQQTTKQTSNPDCLTWLPVAGLYSLAARQRHMDAWPPPESVCLSQLRLW